ncbi:hypothetical protein FHR83_007723 [Actinoplanes campanulatus]|uniref:Uncharacterized protein n=1 Tax=Actinoplanes campanulatus TaxID=113559 RepID=A0A7W5APN4_9ACTN|nr:hypothetical protein [Actinoplanes campanulatus]MBB3100005.1 hypothetical protein [Actinoplanes campanulatus]GGN29479.1 hypothetical protein GCM10010109_48520 [Actinoplanes campanulatus]GID38872.1 hypothetical protein Aca09nite_53780 [Actinoplanes campanulatus]
MDADDVIESYVHDVARRLPPRKRDDVAFELRALLREDLRSRPDGGTPESAVEMLRELGRPAETAARYHRPFTLVEPSDTWSFLVAAVAGGVVAWVMIPPKWTSVATLAWLGLLVIGFAGRGLILRRRPEAFAWRPHRVRRTDRASRAGVLAQFTAWAVLLVVYLNPGPLTYTDDFAGPLRMPWLVAILALHLALLALVFQRGRWQAWTRWTRLLLTVEAGLQLGWHCHYGDVFADPGADALVLPWVAALAGVLILVAALMFYREVTRVEPAPRLSVV